MGIRPLTEQFEPEKVRRIKQIQSDLENSLPHEGPIRFYVSELINSLEAGLLLASLHLACSYIEVYFRELNIDQISQDFAMDLGIPSTASADQIERSLEDSTDPRWSFYKLVDDLLGRGILTEEDAEDSKEIYRNIRIPLHHGLTRRLLRGERSEDTDPTVFTQELNPFISRRLRRMDLDLSLEESSLEIIEFIVSIALRYEDVLSA